jgi:anti-sigma regulatory factor (Ser/Thr protein kinase)
MSEQSTDGRGAAGASVMAVFESDVGAAHRAREWLSRVCADLVEPALLEDARLVLSELVTNAVIHGAGDVVARAAISASGQLAVSTTDSGDASRSGPGARHGQQRRIGGYGLPIVERLTAAWGVASFPGGKTIWAVLDPR